MRIKEDITMSDMFSSLKVPDSLAASSIALGRLSDGVGEPYFKYRTGVLSTLPAYVSVVPLMIR